MKNKFSRKWKSSKQPRKQRKYVFNAPLHLKHKFLSAHLSEELIKKYKKRNFPVRKGDKVKVMSGQFKGISGIINKINLKKTRIFVDGAELIKRDGTKAFYPLHPSKVMIQELDLKDKERKKSIERIQK